MRRRIGLSSIILILGVVAFLSGSAAAETTLTVAMHYGAGQKEYLLPYFDEYMKLHPDVEIVYQELTFDDYLQTVLTSRLAGQQPDIYHLYSLWGVQMAWNGVLAAPPRDVQNWVKDEFVESSVSAVTIDGTVWGIPTEINNYLLLYNKRLLEEAGYTEPPTTWDELVDIAVDATTRNEQDRIVQAGYAFMQGWDSAVVHPFLALLYGEGGQMFTDDMSEAAFNSPAGVRALEKELALFEAGATDPGVSVWNFPTGTIAMTIMAPWYEISLQDVMGDAYTDIGVAPIPAGPAGVKTVQYTYWYAVDSRSDNQEEAWRFLRWLNSKRDGGRTSPMGDMIVTLGAIPSNEADITGHPEELSDAFSRPFVEALDYSIAEPNVMQGQEIKVILMNYILEAWHGNMSAKEALDAAAQEVDDILWEFY